VALVGGELVTRLYGDAYGGQQTVVAVLAKAIGMTARQGLWVIGQPALRFRTDVLGVVVTFATATILIREWGSLGVAVGTLAGHVAAGSLQWVMFALRLKGPPAPVDGDLPRRAPSLVAP
jgi:O-antigen/teichoic acid export membrane protein